MDETRVIHFEVMGPGRDYDCTTFCEDCWPQALECASDWMEEQADGADVGETVTISFGVKDGSPERCYGTHESPTKAGEGEE